MILYQRTQLSDGAAIGEPGNLPAELFGLNDATLADLSAAIPGAADELGFAGQGFLSVELPDPPTPLPAEIPMHKAMKAMAQLGPAGDVVQNSDVSWEELILAAVAAIPSKPQRRSIEREIAHAPNLVLAGSTTQMIKAAIGMSDVQLEAAARLALTLP